MKNLKFYLDSRDAKADDALATIRIKLTKDGKASYLATDIRVTKAQWDASQELVISHPRAKSINLYLAQQMTEVENILISHKEEFRPLSAGDIMKKVRIILNPDVVDKSKDLFIPYAQKFLQSREKKRTQQLYEATIAQMRKFAPNHESLRFNDITPDWLRNFDKFLAKTSPARNARNIHFRNIRAVFNDAIDEEITTYYPFRKFKIRHEATAKRSLTIEQLAEFFTHTPEAYAVRYLDMFKLMFYLIGINTVDLCGLKEITAGRIVYHRAKTNRLYSIKIEPEAMEIIEKYNGGDHLINFLGNYSTYLSFGRQMIHALHEMGKKLDGKKDKIYSGITTYWARHSWATIAAELEVPKETIAAALGHGGNEVTDVYIRFDEKKIDKANRQVIDYLNKAIAKRKAGN